MKDYEGVYGVAAEFLSPQELEFLNELQTRGVRYLIVGLSAAAMQGAPVVTQDVDIWFENISDKRILDALTAVGGTFVPQGGLEPPAMAGDAVKLYDIVPTVHGIRSFADEYPNAPEIQIGGLKVKILGLDRIIKSKEYLQREKDKLVLPVLKQVLQTLQQERPE